MGRWLPRMVLDLTALGAAVASTVSAAVLVGRVQAAPSSRVITWLGGWTPTGPPGAGFSVGIVFAVDPLGSVLALLSGVLTVAVLIFSWRRFTVSGPAFHALMLLLLGGLVGFACTGDLFSLFVFFELTSTAAYALTGYLVAGPAVPGRADLRRDHRRRRGLRPHRHHAALRPDRRAGHGADRA